MKKIFLLLTLLLANIIARAQHCPFDGTGIIVVNIHGHEDNISISGLEVFLCDSLGNPYEQAPASNGRTHSFDCSFHQNPATTTFRGYIDNNHPAEPRKIRFPFAGDDYVLLCERTYDTFKAYVKVIDPQGRFAESSAIKLFPVDVYSLCGNYRASTYNSSRFYGRIYHPVEIKLYPLQR